MTCFVYSINTELVVCQLIQFVNLVTLSSAMVDWMETGAMAEEKHVLLNHISTSSYASHN